MNKIKRLPKNGNDVFISYRRSEGWELARLLYQALTVNKYKVFFDIEKIFKGKFDDKLKTSLEECKVFILVLTRKTLHRCVKDKDDWVKKEIETAMSQHKLIIPVVDKMFRMPKGLDKKFQELIDESKYPVIHIDRTNFESCINAIWDVMISKFKLSMIEEDQHPRFTPKWRLKKFSKELEKTGRKKGFTTADHEQVEKDVYSRFRTDSTADRLVQHIQNEIAPNINYGFSELNVLEIGSMWGVFCLKMLKSNMNISKYVCTDFNPLACEVMNVIAKNIPNKMQVYNLFPEDKEFAKSLLKIKNKLGNKFDLIIVNQSLTFYKDIDSILVALKAILSDEGKIVIIETDDAFNFTYPDKNQIIKKFETFKASTQFYGNVYTGRELYTRLVNLNFKDVNLRLLCDDSYLQSNKTSSFNSSSNSLTGTFYSKKTDFLETFNDVLHYYEELNKTQKGKDQAGAKWKWLIQTKDALIEAYCSTNVFKTNNFFIVTASK